LEMGVCCHTDTASPSSTLKTDLAPGLLHAARHAVSLRGEPNLPCVASRPRPSYRSSPRIRPAHPLCSWAPWESATLPMRARCSDAHDDTRRGAQSWRVRPQVRPMYGPERSARGLVARGHWHARAEGFQRGRWSARVHPRMLRRGEGGKGHTRREPERFRARWRRARMCAARTRTRNPRSCTASRTPVAICHSPTHPPSCAPRTH